MFTDSEARQRDIVADYWQAYFEWRATYGLSDACMGELLAALRVEAGSPDITAEQATKLLALAQMIETQLAGEQEVFRAA